MKGKIYNYFPGGNTSQGFYSFYKYIIRQETARRVICIKGGPGTGKSSLMKKVGNYFNDKGYDIELHHCSSDNNSLDGVVIKGLNVAVLDGTAPHVVDPVNPGAVDEVLNMGEHWNEDGFKSSREKIIETNKQIGDTFRSAYRYLGAAKLIHDDWAGQIGSALIQEKVNMLEKELMSKINIPSMPGVGFQRHLFATAFTPEGIVTFIDNLVEDYEKIYVLNGAPGTGQSEILADISNTAARNGHDVEIYHHPLIPEEIEHVLIPDINTAIVTSNEINNMSFTGNQIYMENYIQLSRSSYSKDRILVTKNNFDYLIKNALNLINSAKKLHDQLETNYIPNMNFKEIDMVYDNLIDKLLKYEMEI